MFTIAKLTAQDAPAYRALMLEAYAQPGDAFTSTAEERAALPLSWWAQRAAAADGSGLALGAWVGNALVGSVALEFSSRAKTRHRAHLVGMYVQPAHQGQGMARALMQAALAEAVAHPGVRWVTLTVTEGNAPAQRLYESCGFRVFGLEPEAICTERACLGKVHMGCPLDLPPPAPRAAQPVRLRPAVAADATALSALAARCFHDTYAADNRPEDLWAYITAHFHPAQQQAELADPALRTWLAEEGDRLVGFAQLAWGGELPAAVTQDRPVALHRFYVVREQQGTGLAGRLMAAIRQEAAQAGVGHLWLSVWERNARAIAFYRKCGFEAVGHTTFDVGADRQRDWVMVGPTGG